MPESAKAEAKASVVLKVIRADGTEESYASQDVTVSDADAVAKLIRKMDPGDGTGPTAEEVAARNDEESRRNAEANEQAAAAAQKGDD